MLFAHFPCFSYNLYYSYFLFHQPCNIMVTNERKESEIMFEHYGDLLTVEDFCEMLSIGKNGAYQLLASGKVKAFRYNRVWKIPKQAVVEYVLTQSKLA